MEAGLKTGHPGIQGDPSGEKAMDQNSLGLSCHRPALPAPGTHLRTPVSTLRPGQWLSEKTLFTWCHSELTLMRREDWLLLCFLPLAPHGLVQKPRLSHQGLLCGLTSVPLLSPPCTTRNHPRKSDSLYDDLMQETPGMIFRI